MKSEADTNNTEVLPGIPGSTELGWVPPEDITRETWLESFNTVSRYDKALHWVMGDIIIWGEDHLAEDVYQIYSELDYADKTVEKIIKICRAFPIEERRPNVSFWKHEILAPKHIPKETRDNILDEANDVSEGGLTEAEMRTKVKKAEQAPFGKPETVEEEHCPSCGAHSQFWAKPPTELAKPSAGSYGDLKVRLQAV